MGTKDLMEEKTIRRNLRGASMTAICRPEPSNRALKASRKPIKLHRAGMRRPTLQPPPDVELKSGYVLPMARGMKRLGMPIAALFGVVLIGLIAMSWFLNRE